MLYFRRSVVPGFVFAAAMGLVHHAAAQAAAPGTAGGAASPAATTDSDDEESPATQAKETTAGPRAAVKVEATPVAAEPDAALTEVDAPADHWEFFTNGRIGSFISYAKGDGQPYDLYNNQTGMKIHSVDATGGGSGSVPQIGQPVGVLPNGMPSGNVSFSVDYTRVRSGFTGNVIGMGVKRRLGDTKVTAYTSVTSIVDSAGQKKYNVNVPDVREAYIKFEGKWGSVLAGRAANLFNRGAVETDFLYLHGYGLGFPGLLDSGGSQPTAGQIGYGVLANGFGAGFVYATPKLAGVQVSVGLFDPSLWTGTPLERTKYPRGEFEGTVDEALGTAGKVHLYVNGGYQENYQRNLPDTKVGKMYGVGYGGRVELGPVHLGAGGFSGKGLGITYPGASGLAATDSSGTLNDNDGFYVMAQIVLGKFDVNGGFGQSRIRLTPAELTADPMTGQPATSYVDSQNGTSGAVVYHAADWLHFDIDVMHADTKWDLGERQRINYYNAGTTVTW